MRGMLLRFASEVKDAVADVSRVYVDEVRKASADGVLTLEEKANAKKMAIAAVKLNFGIQGLKRLVRILGVTDVDGWLGGHVDVEVAVQKATKT